MWLPWIRRWYMEMRNGATGGPLARLLGILIDKYVTLVVVCRASSLWCSLSAPSYGLLSSRDILCNSPGRPWLTVVVVYQFLFFVRYLF